MKLLDRIIKIERFIGSVKFAVIIIILFAAILCYGTFMESYHGTDYANRLVYKSMPFMVLQGFMFLSIFVATLLRFPYRKRLLGFYVLHLGLLLLFMGSFVTYYAGVDGNLTLAPNTPSNKIDIPRDILKINVLDRNKKLLGSYEYTLPYVAKETKLNIKLDEHIPKDILGTFSGASIKSYLPFADLETKWIESADDSGASYHLFNDRFGQKFTMTLSDSEHFKSTITMGPLNVHYMPEAIFPCLSKNDKTRFIIWDAKDQKCTPAYKLRPREYKIDKLEYMDINIDGEVITYVPKKFPYPISTSPGTSKYRVFAREMFETVPHLFLFGKNVAFYNKYDEAWQSFRLDNYNVVKELPWMGFKLRLTDYQQGKKPIKIPNYVTPIQDNNELLNGGVKAINFVKKDKTFWVTNEKPLGLAFGNRQLDMLLTTSSIVLPYELNLTKFKMDKDRGTNNPASYESYVNLFTGDNSSTHHIFMNNPLKYDNFTFYQASYFKAGEQFGSVLSVNFDPGRWIKYLGSLLLVLGSIWHFGFANRRKRKS